MIELITWYLKNTKETLPKFQKNNIYILHCRNFGRNLVEPVYQKKNYLKNSNVSRKRQLEIGVVTVSIKAEDNSFLR